MSSLLDVLQEKLSKKNVRIVLPESEGERVLTAATKLQATNYITPLVLDNEEKVNALAQDKGLNISSVQIIDPSESDLKPKLVKSFVERCKGKATEEQAQELLNDVNYFETMLVYAGYAEGLVSGAVHSTGDTARPASQIAKTGPDVSRTSDIFFMIKEDKQYILDDCAINPTLESSNLAGITVESTRSAKSFGINPCVTMLSFSTKGSAKLDDVEKVANAVELAQEKVESEGLDNIVVNGRFQFDAAIVPTVTEKKAPGAKIQGDTNVFVFPSLEAGNIGYKITQRLGGFEAIGPVLQGLNSPVNDLSRDCSIEDVYNLSIIITAQTLQ